MRNTTYIDNPPMSEYQLTRWKALIRLAPTDHRLIRLVMRADRHGEVAALNAYLLEKGWL